MISMKKLRFSSRPRTKVRRHGPPGSSRAQPCRHCCSIIITEPDENVDSSDLGDPKKRKVPANESCRRLSLKGSSLRKCVLESINEEEQIFTKKQQSHGRA